MERWQHLASDHEHQASPLALCIPLAASRWRCISQARSMLFQHPVWSIVTSLSPDSVVASHNFSLLPHCLITFLAEQSVRLRLDSDRVTQIATNDRQGCLPESKNDPASFDQADEPKRGTK